MTNDVNGEIINTIDSENVPKPTDNQTQDELDKHFKNGNWLISLIKFWYKIDFIIYLFILFISFGLIIFSITSIALILINNNNSNILLVSKYWCWFLNVVLLFTSLFIVIICLIRSKNKVNDVLNLRLNSINDKAYKHKNDRIVVSGPKGIGKSKEIQKILSKYLKIKTNSLLVKRIDFSSKEIDSFTTLMRLIKPTSILIPGAVITIVTTFLTIALRLLCTTIPFVSLFLLFLGIVTFIIVGIIVARTMNFWFSKIILFENLNRIHIGDKTLNQNEIIQLIPKFYFLESKILIFEDEITSTNKGHTEYIDPKYITHYKLIKPILSNCLKDLLEMVNNNLEKSDLTFKNFSLDSDENFLLIAKLMIQKYDFNLRLVSSFIREYLEIYSKNEFLWKVGIDFPFFIFIAEIILFFYINLKVQYLELINYFPKIKFDKRPTNNIPEVQNEQLKSVNFLIKNLNNKKYLISDVFAYSWNESELNEAKINAIESVISGEPFSYDEELILDTNFFIGINDAEKLASKLAFYSDDSFKKSLSNLFDTKNYLCVEKLLTLFESSINDVEINSLKSKIDVAKKIFKNWSKYIDSDEEKIILKNLLDLDIEAYYSIQMLQKIDQLIKRKQYSRNEKIKFLKLLSERYFDILISEDLLNSSSWFKRSFVQSNDSFVFDIYLTAISKYVFENHEPNKIDEAFNCVMKFNPLLYRDGKSDFNIVLISSEKSKGYIKIGDDMSYKLKVENYFSNTLKKFYNQNIDIFSYGKYCKLSEWISIIKKFGIANNFFRKTKNDKMINGKIRHFANIFWTVWIEYHLDEYLEKEWENLSTNSSISYMKKIIIEKSDRIYKLLNIKIPILNFESENYKWLNAEQESLKNITNAEEFLKGNPVFIMYSYRNSKSDFEVILNNKDIISNYKQEDSGLVQFHGSVDNLGEVDNIEKNLELFYTESSKYRKYKMKSDHPSLCIPLTYFRNDDIIWPSEEASFINSYFNLDNSIENIRKIIVDSDSGVVDYFPNEINTAQAGVNFLEATKGKMTIEELEWESFMKKYGFLFKDDVGIYDNKTQLEYYDLLKTTKSKINSLKIHAKKPEFENKKSIFNNRIAKLEKLKKYYEEKSGI